MKERSPEATLIQLASHFTPEHTFTPDRIAMEYRMLIVGYLNQAQALLSQNMGVQEFGNCIVRIHELARGILAHELSHEVKNKSLLEEKKESP